MSDIALYETVVVVLAATSPLAGTLGALLGKIWSDRVARNEQAVLNQRLEDAKATHVRQLEDFRAGQAIILEQERQKGLALLEQQKATATQVISRLNWELDSEKQRRVFAHSLQFRKEFETYEALWTALMPLYDIAVQIRSINDGAPTGVDFEDHKHTQLRKLAECYGTFAETFRLRRPFFSEDVFRACCEIQTLARKEHFAGLRYDRRFERDVEEFYADGEKNMKDLAAKVESLADAIRARIGLITSAAPRAES